jgi:hypothetical protein
MTVKRAIDFAAYIVIALAIGLILVFFAEYDIDPKWFSLLFETALVFGWILAGHRWFWRSPAFWLVYLVIASIHLGILVVIFRHIANVRPFWVAAAFVIETSVLTGLVEGCQRRFIRNRSRIRHD